VKLVSQWCLYGGLGSAVARVPDEIVEGTINTLELIAIQTKRNLETKLEFDFLVLPLTHITLR
jgi:hypothetical protein